MPYLKRWKQSCDAAHKELGFAINLNVALGFFLVALLYFIGSTFFTSFSLAYVMDDSHGYLFRTG